MSKHCKYCSTLLSSVGKGSRAGFCNDNHRYEFNKRKQNSLGAVTPILPPMNPKTKTNPKTNPKMNFPIAPFHQEQSQSYSQTAEYLLHGRINELQAALADMKGDKKEVETELKEKIKEMNALQLKYDTVKRDHEQELSGIEQGQKTWVRELAEFVRDKDAMGNIIDAYSAVKTGKKSENELSEGAEPEEMVALKNFFNKLTDEHKQLITENLYAYGRRPDLLIKQNQELKKYLNK